MLVLTDPPYGPGVDEAKVRSFLARPRPSFNQPYHLCSSRSSIQNLNLQTLVSILNSTKSAEVSNVLKSLSPDAQDTLMKYLYKGMAMPGWGDVSGSVLLVWHEKVCGLFGLLVARSLLTNERRESSLLRLPERDVSSGS